MRVLTIELCLANAATELPAQKLVFCEFEIAKCGIIFRGSGDPRI
jgi:hypothetical protein